MDKLTPALLSLMPLMPRKAARPLFALLAPATFAACASGVGASPASYPLCDGSGAPACGNIGQAGRQGTPAPPDASRTTLLATPRVAAQSFPMFEVATTTLAAVGFAATTMAVLIVSDWGDAPELDPKLIDPPKIDPPKIDPPKPIDVRPPSRSATPVPRPPAPLRPLVDVAALRAVAVRADVAQADEDECKRDQAERPMLDNDYRPACGNVMTKGGHRRGRR